VVKRSAIAVALFLTLIASALVTAQPAAASVTNCSPLTAVVSNTHGRLQVQSCIRHTAGHYYSWGEYLCTKWDDTWRYWAPEPCNIGATQYLWYNATLVRSDRVSALGLNTHEWSFSFSGSPAGCTTAWIQAQINNISVRFTDGVLSGSSGIPVKSDFTAGDPYC
jgi:hypothetical protein